MVTGQHDGSYTLSEGFAFVSSSVRFVRSRHRPRAPHIELALTLRASVPSLRSVSIIRARAHFVPMTADT